MTKYNAYKLRNDRVHNNYSEDTDELWLLLVLGFQNI